MTRPPPQRRSDIARSHLLALLGYLALALWLTWPTAAHLGDAYFTSGNNLFFFPTTPDAPQNIWNFWWVLPALANGQSPFFSPLLYYPQGVQMLVQTMNVVAILLTLPANWLLGPLAAYNVAAILGVALTGYFGFLLVRAFAPGVAGPFVAGALLTACPLHMAKLDSGQLNFVCTQWLVLFMLTAVALVRWQEPGILPPASRLLPPVIAALAFLLVLFTDWYWALVAAAFGGTWMLLGLVGAHRPWQLIRRYTVFGLLTTIACLPLAATLLAGGMPDAGQPQGELWAAYTEGYSSDALGIFFPAALHPLWSLGAERFLVSVSPHGITEGSYTAAGWVLAALGMVGAWRYRRSHWRLLVTGLVGWLLSLGPTLYVLGYATGLPMPYRLLTLLPLLGTARRPNLFGMITIIVLAIFAGLALARLREALAPRRFALAYAAIAALALFELWPPARVAHALERPEVFTRIAAAPGVVVDLPVENDTDSRTLLNQMAHGQPILRGYVARPPHYPTLEYSPLVNRLVRMTTWPDSDIIALDPAALATMQCYYRFRYVVAEKPLLSVEQRADLGETIGLLIGGPPTPWYEDARFVAYELPINPDRCAPFLYLGAGWNDAEQSAERTWRWTNDVSQVYVVNPDDSSRTLQLNFRVEAREEGQPLTIVAGETTISLELKQDLHTYRVAIPVPPGLNQIELRTPTHREVAGRDIGISVQQIRIR